MTKTARDREDRRDRRTEPRYPLGGRIRWQRLDDMSIAEGWVVDRSDSSLSFITAAALNPVKGEGISIISADKNKDGEASEEHLRICRVRPYDARLLLVACVAESRVTGLPHTC